MSKLEITEDTKVSEILDEYGDIADVMEALGMKRVGGRSEVLPCQLGTRVLGRRQAGAAQPARQAGRVSVRARRRHTRRYVEARSDAHATGSPAGRHASCIMRAIR